MSIVAKIIAMAATAVVTRWNPSDKDPAITLSNADLSATNASFTNQSVRAQGAQSTGKRYFEINVDTIPAQVNVGISTASYSLAIYPGATVGSVGYLGTFGTLDIAGAAVANPAAISAAGDVMCFAVDFVNGNIWVKKLGTDWNGNPAADPATNTGGISFTAQIPGDAYIIGAMPSTTITLNSGANGFAGTAPSGFTMWAS